MRADESTSVAVEEIVCDESGWEGSNLVSGHSDVIAYASVRVPADAAEECLRDVSDRAPHLTREYKASDVLRPERRSAVMRLLGQASPLNGNAFVHLTDKALFVVGRVLDLILGQSADAASAGRGGDPRLVTLATSLTREGRDVFGADRWHAFLGASNAILQTWKPRSVREPVDAFMDGVDGLVERSGDSALRVVLEELRAARDDAYAARARLIEHRVLQPALEPLIPALASTVLHWSCGGATDVSIVHDEQSALTDGRIRRLERQVLPPGRALRFRQADSRADPRIQVADVLAGVARKLAADALRGNGDAALRELLRSYIDPASCWCDERSWSVLRPHR